ncbi:MAG: hypothetical protein RBT49_01180 [Bacteroidales bacterium]|nr:hypothetical protein [Bacteroidales bacterium]
MGKNNSLFTNSPFLFNLVEDNLMAVLIITNNLDFVADSVINWIISFKKKVYRYNYEDFLKNATISYKLSNSKNVEMIINGDLIESGWLRKETDDYEKLYNLEKEFGFKDGYEFYKFLKKEASVTKQTFFNNKNIRWLCDYKSINVNKIEVLEIAQKCGLKTPKSLVTNNINSLVQFIENNSIEEFIVKSVGENLSIMYKNSTTIFQPVKSFTTSNMDFPNSFLPTLFQEKIEKQFDIRIFFLNGSFYSMAIDNKSTDSRLTNDSTRYFPYLLPKSIEKKITILMNKMNLNYGSIDLILDKKNYYHFLEVTPTGEFSFVSNNCNYNIEEKIANYLCYGS